MCPPGPGRNGKETRISSISRDVTLVPRAGGQLVLLSKSDHLGTPLIRGMGRRERLRDFPIFMGRRSGVQLHSENVGVNVFVPNIHVNSCLQKHTRSEVSSRSSWLAALSFGSAASVQTWSKKATF